MTQNDTEEYGLKGKAREQILQVAIHGSCVRTKPGFDPDELADEDTLD